MKEEVGHVLMRAAREAPYLARAEEHELAQRWKEDQDQQALHRMTTAHMRLVIAMASRFRGFGLPAADLIQEGHVGLLEAAARFDPERGVRFSTYATWWIRASMQDFVLRNWSIVRGGTSSAQKALFFNFRKLRARLQRHAASKDEVYKEVAKALKVSESDVALMDARLGAPDTSLNAPVREEDDSSQRQDHLPSEAEPIDQTVQQTIDGERRSVRLAVALRSLDGRERTIIRARRLSEDGETLERLGQHLGISKERVRQIESRAIEKLRTALQR